jgi:predicted transcriptional regulator
MSDVEDLLSQLGFGEYESRAYSTLLAHAPVTGYELAKTSGIPRANIYAVLQKLEARGAVIRLDTPDGARYAPTAPAQLTTRLSHQYQTVLQAARTALEAIGPAPEPVGIWQLTGYATLLAQARTALAAVQKEVLIACGPAEARALQEDLHAATARGAQVLTLCLTACSPLCGACQGQIYHATPVVARRWLLLVADETELLAGTIAADNATQAVGTRQPLLVQLVGSYIRQSSALGALLDDLGNQLPGVTSAPTRRLLGQLAPDSLAAAWPEYLDPALLFGLAAGPGEAGADSTPDTRRNP